MFKTKQFFQRKADKQIKKSSDIKNTQRDVLLGTAHAALQVKGGIWSSVDACCSWVKRQMYCPDEF